MAWAAAIPAAMQLGSSLVQAFSGGTDRGNNHRGREARALQAQLWARDDNKVQRLVADAKAAGISPLVALGSSISSSSVGPVQADPGFGNSPISWGSAVGSGLEAVGQGIGDYMRQDADLAQADLDRKEQARQFDVTSRLQARQNEINADAVRQTKMSQNLDLMMKKAQIEEVRSRTMLNALDAQSKGATQGHNVSPGEVSLMTPVGPWKTSKTSTYGDVVNQYGIFAGEGYGLWRAFNDIFYKGSGEKPAFSVSPPTRRRVPDPIPGGPM